MRPLTASPLTAGLLRNTVALFSVLAFLLFCALGCRKVADSTPPEATGTQAKGPSRPEVPDTRSDPVREIGDPANVRAEELTALLEDVPASVRQGRTNLELARELGCRAWVVEYSGGPLSSWLEVEETGQKTDEPRHPGPEGMAWWPCQAAEGRIVMCFRPGAARNNPSARSQRIVQRLGLGEEVAQVFILTGAISGKQLSGAPLNPRWWSGWDDLSLKETRGPAKVPAAEAVALLVLEATEKQPPPGSQPRQVKLTLKARFAGGK